MYQEKFGSWLHSKQNSKSIELLETYEEYNKNIDRDLRTKVVKYVKNNRTKYGRALYKTRNCYVDDITFEAFIVSVIETIEIENMKKLLTKAIDIIMQDKKIRKNYSRDDVLKAIKVYSFYHVYIGYAFEQHVRDLIKSDDNYEIYTSDTLDLKYAIDMQVHSKKHNKVIGLQLKTFTFSNLSVKKRKTYLTRNRNAIVEKYCNDVYYVFHDNRCNIISDDFDCLIHYEKACKGKINYFFGDKESFIAELRRAFERVEKVEENRNLW